MKNKENFVHLFGRRVQDKGHSVQYAYANADVEIVKCAIKKN